ncbi:prostate stem cell antigen [Trachemys scripta elegans]|uniref:prostate stem cell antigen n=1 Tax=Trachemys scripta elegans TaxID=31138 RepID=UPI001552BA22|nr:prostate stem cell antigen [Trachemys scripta elegans]
MLDNEEMSGDVEGRGGVPYSLCLAHPLKMKAFLVILLAAVLCTEPGGSLKCYTCKTQLSNSKCQTAVTCANSSQACKTDVINVVGLFSIINKECAASCELSFQDFTVGKQNVSCCSTDLCNRSGAGSVGSSYATMAAGLTASVLCVLLRNGL